MNKPTHNAKISKSQVTKWEVIKNCQYTDNHLSKITTLYVIKVTQLPDLHTEEQFEASTTLVRISVTGENIFLHKAVTIEIMKEIFPYKFSSKKKNNISRLEDLYNHLCSIVSNSLPREILESLIKEYRNSVNLLRTII